MRIASIAIVAAGLGLAVVLGFAWGFDAAAVVILGCMALVGALAIAVAYRSRGRAVRPAACAECGGVISPNAPYCKHCGTRRMPSAAR